MNCPKCGARMPVADRVCRECHFLPDAGRVISLAPPRALRFHRSGGRVSFWRMWRIRRDREPKPMRWWMPIVAGIVPGLGHMLRNQTRRGLVFFGVVAAAITVASIIQGTVAQVCFGLAATVHALSLCELYPGAANSDLPNRVFRMSVTLFFMGVCIYSPLMGVLAPAPQLFVRTGAGGALFYRIAEIILTVGFCVGAFVIFSVFAAGFSGMLSDPFGRKRK